jgi:hypothetical protein
MDEQIKKLAKLRSDLAAAKVEKVAFLENMQKDGEYIRIMGNVKDLEQLVMDLETTIKDQAVETFTQTGNKAPTDGVKIKMYTTVRINDEGRAREWCLHNFTPALKLDVKTIEKAVKDKTVPEDLAETADEPRATIATDLDKYLE